MNRRLKKIEKLKKRKYVHQKTHYFVQREREKKRERRTIERSEKKKRKTTKTQTLWPLLLLLRLLLSQSPTPFRKMGSYTHSKEEIEKRGERERRKRIGAPKRRTLSNPRVCRPLLSLSLLPLSLPPLLG